MPVTHHQKCLRRAKVRRKAGHLSNKLNNIVRTDNALRNILGISTNKERVEEVMEKAKHGSEITARYILSHYYRYPRKLLKTMSDEECQSFLNVLGKI
ncbi:MULTISPECIES: hypothetical protein [Bacteria]|uniref:hypothetical protein n=1 Tax=Bacteria TaxID=2 RepID=UPI0005C188BA|nr:MULTISPECIES: hypothetical protein [Bacteria]KIV39897.1 hypothetical protein TR09_02500 [Vibrio parahaemolyticus]MED3865409.1 hypothetical protein [Priestia megaterium]MED3976753.1 hypothetical protein [Priestia megaterium]MED4219191.1 hypothetical protein [Priestia megaterium]MEE3897559.1 hypothetical protein [Priestia megaterium]